MKRGMIIILILTIFLVSGIAGCEKPTEKIIETGEKTSETMPETELEIENPLEEYGDMPKECLEKQEEVYKEGYGGPMRITNKCEIFAKKIVDPIILNVLTETKDFPTLTVLAGHPNLTPEISIKIYQRKDLHENSFTGREGYDLNSKQGIVKQELSRNQNTDPSILSELGKFDEKEHYQNLYILQGVANNQNTPVETLIALSKHKNGNVLRSLAGNPKTPGEVLAYLSQDFENEDFVNSAIAGNPNTPKEVLVKFLKEKGNTNVINNFGSNILRIEEEILGLRNYYLEHFPSETTDEKGNLLNLNYESLLRDLNSEKINNEYRNL